MWPSTFEHPHYGRSRILGNAGDFVVFEWWSAENETWVRATDRLSNYNLKFKESDPATLAAQIFNWPTKAELVSIFRSDRYAVKEGKYSIVLEDFGHFAFRELGQDLGEGCISAYHESVEELTIFSKRVSATLARVGIKHRFEVYSNMSELAAYFHHEWPKDWKV